MFKVLVVDDDQGLRFSVRETLSRPGAFGPSFGPLVVDEAFDGVSAVEKVKAEHYDLAILDVDMPRLNGMDALKLIKENDPRTLVLMMTAYATIDDAVRAVKEGAYNYISKPIKGDELLELVKKALRAQNLISNVAASAPVLTEAGRKIIGNTSEMQKVFNIINRLSKVDTPVLIRGASGTGKELVARAIHFNSHRKDQKFVPINCSAIPENLFESELFGHEKGSFTGADQRKIGKFQFAEGGTLFLDELGDMPILMQVKLLRVLQEKLFTPVGANREIEANVRIIAATNRPLEEMMKKGEFREDLFYRLNVMPIFLPALADRRNDLENLIHTFIKKFNASHNRKIIGVAPEALGCLKKYDWPGNIRELENVIEHAFILENSNLLTLASLPEYVLSVAGISLDSTLNSIQLDEANFESGLESDDDESDLTDPNSDLDEKLDDGPNEEMVSINGDTLDFNKHKEAFEREFIIKALKTFNGRINQTALHANIPKKTLLRKIEKYGINARDYTEVK
jgi:DNA-binding NtrC family response regulator